MTRPRYPSDAKTYDRGTVETKLRLSPEARAAYEWITLATGETGSSLVGRLLIREQRRIWRMGQ